MKTDTEIWKVVPSNRAYEVSNLGRVRRIGRKDCLTPSPCTKRRYLGVCLSSDGQGRTRYVHCLLGEAFLNVKPGQVVHHRDNCPQNPLLDNLEVCSQKENMRRSVTDGTAHILPGERAPHLWGKRGALSASQVQCLRRARESGKVGAVAALAREYGVPANVAHSAASGRTYTWVGATALDAELLRQEVESARALRKAIAQANRAKAARAAKGSK